MMCIIKWCFWKLHMCHVWLVCTSMYIYAVKAQTSLAPLSWFHGSRVTTAHVHQCCIFQRYAKTVPSRMKLTMTGWQCVNLHPWQRTRDHGVWRLTLTAYWVIFQFYQNTTMNSADESVSKLWMVYFIMLPYEWNTSDIVKNSMNPTREDVFP